MKVLFVTPQIPYPARQGTAIRNAGLMENVAARHSVAFVSLLTPGQAPPPVGTIRASFVAGAPQPPWRAAARLAALFAGQPDLARRLWSQQFAGVLGQAVRQIEPHIVQIEGLELAPYIPVIRRAAPRTKIIYDAHNTEYVIQRRAWQVDRGNARRWLAAIYSALQERRLRDMEGAVGKDVEALCCVSDEDARALDQLGPRTRPIVVPNGIDPDAYDAGEFTGRSGLGPCDLVFTGKMDYRPNLDAVVWFASEVLPLIRVQEPAARLAVVGQASDQVLRRYAGRQEMFVTGAVEDTRPYIADGAVFVAPLRMGGGTRFKLLEAMALARPVVSTRLGAEGIRVEDGREVLLADGPQAMAAACLQVMRDQALAARLGQAGRSFVRANHAWSVIVPRLEAVYEDLAAAG